MKKKLSPNTEATDLRLEELIDITLFQKLQDDLNRIYPFPSAIIDNDGVVLTATAWQDICTKFHRKHPDCEKECIKSDRYIVDHIEEANPAVVYTCPHGLTDTAMPIIVEGIHLANFFTGQFFLEKPDIEYFHRQAEKYGFEEKSYLAAVARTPVIKRETMVLYHDLIKTFTDILIKLGQEKIVEIETIRAIKKSEEKYRTLFESMAQGVFYQDSDGNLIDVNPAALEMFGLTRDEFMGRTSYHVEWKVFNEREELLKPAEHPSMIALLSGKPVKDMLVGVYNPVKKKNIWMIANAIPKFREGHSKPVQVSVTLQDITARREAEVMLARSEKTINTIHDNISDIVWQLDKDTRITYITPSVEKLFGYRPDELIGRHIIEFIDKRYHKIAKENISQRNSRLHKIQRKHFEYEMITRDGRTIEVEVSSNPITDPNGSVTGFTGITRDITERKLAEDALKKSEAAMSEAQHIAKIGSWEWDMVTNRVTWSKEMFKVLDIDPADFDGNPESMIRVIHPDDIASFRETMKANLEGGRSHALEYRIVHRDGSVHSVFAVGHNEFDEYGKPIRSVGTVQDITDRKEAEEQLRRNQETLKQKIGELERFNHLTVNREIKMIELKEEINALLSRLGEEPRYRIAR